MMFGEDGRTRKCEGSDSYSLQTDSSDQDEPFEVSLLFRRIIIMRSTGVEAIGKHCSIFKNCIQMFKS